LGPFDPLPLPFGKVIGEGVKGAKAGVRAVRGAVRGADEAVEAAARGTWSVDYPEAELVPIEFFDDMPSVNMEAGRAGDVDMDLFSYKITSEDLERLGPLAEQADLGPREFRAFATEVLGGADKLELENFGALMADMETRGLDNPLVVYFDPDTGGVILGEGNHRLAAARELGWDVVPVSVHRSSVAAELDLDIEKLLPPLEQLDVGDLPSTRLSKPVVDAYGVLRYTEGIPAAVSPSQVGMPTASGVARETGEPDWLTNPVAHDPAPPGSTHRQLSGEIGEVKVVRDESGEMMLEVDDAEAFDAALKSWEEANRADVPFFRETPDPGADLPLPSALSGTTDVGEVSAQVIIKNSMPGSGQFLEGSLLRPPRGGRTTIDDVAWDANPGAFPPPQRLLNVDDLRTYADVKPESFQTVRDLGAPTRQLREALHKLADRIDAGDLEGAVEAGEELSDAMAGYHRAWAEDLAAYRVDNPQFADLHDQHPLPEIDPFADPEAYVGRGDRALGNEMGEIQALVHVSLKQKFGDDVLEQIEDIALGLSD